MSNYNNLLCKNIGVIIVDNDCTRDNVSREFCKENHGDLDQPQEEHKFFIKNIRNLGF